MTRRSLLVAAGGLATAAIAPANLQAVETLAGGRLGFALIDKESGKTSGHRLDERFALCSTFKLFLAGFVLMEADASKLTLSDKVPITKADLVPWAPATASHVGGTMTLRALAEAAQTRSDNVAANLLMRRLGGPAGVTQKLRSLGDSVTRIDRWEPELNAVRAGDPRDTSTPRAMAETTAKLVLGDVLAPGSRALLVRWMVESKTGANRLRGGAPGTWKAGNKSGTATGKGVQTRVNDVAVLWPPHRAPFVAAGFHEAAGSHPQVRPQDEQVLADAMLVALGPLSDT